MIGFPNMRSQKVFPGAILRDDDLDNDLVLNAAMKGLVFLFLLGPHQLGDGMRFLLTLFYR